VDDRHSDQKVKSYAGTPGNMALGDASHVTAGVRFTSDKREFRGTDI
jgi:hypothetical protein